ncbi:MAG: peptidoglycan-binding protein [Treponema sp.]|nr:peptidoglycan-binding protein [Treponema sp.]
MNCERALHNVYEGDAMSLLTRIGLGLHLLFCSDCTRKVERFELCKDILSSEFFPPSPGLENTVMAMVAAEEREALESERADLSGGFSLRGWVIAGIVMFVSLATAFFGLDFNKVALAAGMSYLIPIGITIGIALTCYGALFIGSHLKELTERFGL